jgi:hypothetical protein
MLAFLGKYFMGKEGNCCTAVLIRLSHMLGAIHYGDLFSSEFNTTFPYSKSWYLMTSSSVTQSVYYVNTNGTIGEVEQPNWNVEMSLRPVIHVDSTLYAISDHDGGYVLSDSFPDPEPTPVPSYLNQAGLGSIVKFSGQDWIVTNAESSELLLKDSLGDMPWDHNDVSMQYIIGVV